MTTAPEIEITELMRQIHVAREALQRIGEIAVPTGVDTKPALIEAQTIAETALREAGWLPQ